MEVCNTEPPVVNCALLLQMNQIACSWDNKGRSHNKWHLLYQLC